ncbi:YceI family protein [Pseudomonas panipatensis]|uniref:Polyisoprenoid-binding protein YceI n=1 Tax=Pseudomonas panipatensis TaxID=428992 RepID=A0A1G8FU25_9PSED|nr:YceI family protein [Pseudomonas panipatensis]SDH85639.1 Polyisoprenoid-binding protein YceI [Pseudomonas panipatensis]SMP52288.1 Polyisoprenoid-binding protein YceI [Pseudomonas panipatensis]
MKRLALALALAAGVTPAVFATEYTKIQPDKSSIAFAYQQMGVSMDGRFKAFTGQISFDPAQPEKTKATLDVDLSSVDTGSPENDSEVTGKSWFNTQSFPSARFEVTGVKALGGNRYEVAGKLSIKGTTRDLVAPATFTEQGNAGVFEGSFTLRRGDYAIGEGDWSTFDVVANEIKVNVRVTALAN